METTLKAKVGGKIVLAGVMFVAVGSFSLWNKVPQARGAAVDDVYLDKCSVCHGPDGAGQTAKGKKLKVKDLRSAEVQKLSDAQLYDVIAKGQGKDMAGFEAELGKDTVQQLAAYTRELAKKK